MAEEFISQGQVDGTSPAEVVVNYIKVETVGAQPKFVFDGFLNGRQPDMTVQRGSTYYFDQSDSTNGSNTLALFTAANGSGAYAINWSTISGPIHKWIVAADAPATLYYSKAGVTSALQGGTISCVDAPVAWGADTGKSYIIEIDCSGNQGVANGTISPERLGDAIDAGVSINSDAEFLAIEKGAMRWGAILEVLGERENPNYVTWPGVGAGNVRDGSYAGNFTDVKFTANWPTYFTPTTYLTTTGTLQSTVITTPDDAIKRAIAKVLSNASKQNRSFGSIESGTSTTVKDHNSVTAEAMFVDFATALTKITVT